MRYAAYRSPSFRAEAQRRRREGVRARATWRDPLRRARRAIRSAAGRIETSGQVIDATLRLGADRPMQRARQLCNLYRWIGEAELRLQRALHRVDESVQRLALAPEHAEDFPSLFLEAALRCAETAVRLDQVAQRAAEASAQIVEETRVWAATAAATTAAPAQPARAAAPRYPRFVFVVIIRRSPAAFATGADAARKVSRGRAPPLSQPARSIHRS